MQLRLEALEPHLAKGLAGLYTVYGDEPLLAQEACDRIRAAARAAGFTERSVFTVERSFDWSSLLGASQAMSLFGERQLIELRIPSGKPGKEGADALKTLAGAGNPDMLMLVTLPRLDAATQKSAWFTALGNGGVALKIDPVDRAQLPNWIGQRLAAQGQRVAAGDDGRRALQFIAERVEGNLLAAHQEIQKLGLLYPSGTLAFEQVQDAVLNVARYDVFKLNEAMLAGDAGRLARMIDGLKGEGEALVLVLWAVVEELRTLLRIKRGIEAGKPLAVLVRENRVWGPRERLIGPALSRVTEPVLEKALALAARLDRQVKGLSGATPGLPRADEPPPDPWDGLFQLAMTVAGAQGASRSPAGPRGPAARQQASGSFAGAGSVSRRPG
ncbi:MULTISPECIES: DNA polymerase III subunit delta [Burkholderia]|uniref:DNA polymerase III subunit delta n=1 Tax=Burkholderia TaxID=32008 RepID=UPI000BBD0811|nr:MULTISPECIES: DNA polymerase III subunit delta [Burkholderia]ATF85493.1 DNA polymerase III subunit delta [Burkholderia gladioli pv. gladioli]MBJ9710250.1 DNA polymerase III subunit delta [Burkholderia gladioli]MBU9153969.1 DNA polymerase III subunit delta [Burkholderia gladioli]MBU9214376.1 DNA polymerase III subunit delta [Burkholderia gladioli]MCH7271110.1 DNA polymerase III subunit delta [Burkholderia gladioli]